MKISVAEGFMKLVIWSVHRRVICCRKYLVLLSFWFLLRNTSVYLCHGDVQPRMRRLFEGYAVYKILYLQVITKQIGNKI